MSGDDAAAARANAIFLGSQITEGDEGSKIFVQDGLGGEKSVGSRDRRSFPVKLDDDGYIYWRSAGSRFEGIPVTERTRLTWSSTNFLEVSRNGSTITWSCFDRVHEPPRATAPRLLGLATSTPVPTAPPLTPTQLGGPRAEGAVPAWLQPEDRRQLQEVATVSLGVARSMATDFIDYIEEAPRRLSSMCLCGGLGVAVNGLIGVAQALQAGSHTVYYLVPLYAVFFGLVTCITELHPDTSPDLYRTFWGVQRWMHEWAKGLTTLWGRGLFNIFQGALACVGSGLLSFGILVGMYMIFMGLVYLRLHFRAPLSRTTQEDYIRIT